MISVACDFVDNLFKRRESAVKAQKKSTGGDSNSTTYESIVRFSVNSDHTKYTTILQVAVSHIRLL